MRRALTIATLLAALGGSAAAATAPLPGVWEYAVSATCVETCGDAGMADGGALTGQITLTTGSFAPHAEFGGSILASFGFSFGSSGVNFIDAAGVQFAGAWGASPGEFDALSLFAGTRDSTGAGAAIALGLAASLVSTDAYCVDGCQSIEMRSLATTGSLAVQLLPSPTPIPLPPAAGLLLGGVATLALAARRSRRSGPPQSRPISTARRWK